jgi:hypothetical protein
VRPSDAGGGFGRTLASDGVHAVVGSPYYDAERGKVAIYEMKSGELSLMATFHSPFAGRQLFGGRVAIRGERMAVAAIGPDGLVSRVHTFRMGGAAWVEDQEVVTEPPLTSIGDLALDCSDMIVGNPAFNAFAGRVAVYRLAPVGAPTLADTFEVAGSEEFGSEVILDGDQLLIGAVGAFQSFSRSESGAWQLSESILVAEPTAPGFGYSRAISGETAVVAASLEGVPGARGRGQVHVYRRTSRRWEPSQKLASPSDRGLDFGERVALSGSRLAVASRGREEEDPAGTVDAYRFDGTRWVEEGEVLPPPGTPAAHFGRYIAMAGNVLLVGAPLTNGGDGAVYVYRHE